MISHFKLLLHNPILASYNNQLITSKLINQVLGYQFSLPEITKQPFIFGCFALSIDGKLCYMDNPSGFNIASCNKTASELERKADLDYLMLARTISDAVIIGTNSLNLEYGHYTTSITNPILALERVNLNKSSSPLAIIMCRNLDNINFSWRLFSDDEFEVIICCTKANIDLRHLPSNYKQLQLNSFDRQNLTKKNIITGVNLSELLITLKQNDFNIILNESPYIHHLLLENKLLNELWLNYSNVYIGGNATSLGGDLAPFSSINHPETTLLTIHSLGYNFIYTRQVVNY